jgi:hypothetical protein
MFKRLWESLNYWAEVLDMNDPRGEYVFRLEERVANPEQRRLGRMTVSINCNRERRRSRDTSFPTVNQAVLKVI